MKYKYSYRDRTSSNIENGKKTKINQSKAQMLVMNKGGTQVSVETIQPVHCHELWRPRWGVFFTSLNVTSRVSLNDVSRSNKQGNGLTLVCLSRCVPFFRILTCIEEQATCRRGFHLQSYGWCLIPIPKTLVHDLRSAPRLSDGLMKPSSSSK